MPRHKRLPPRQARYDRIKAINGSPESLGSVTDALDNAILVRLQERYLDLARQQSDFVARYGQGHRTALALDREIAENRRDMSAELRRLEETYKSEYEIASTRLAQLQGGLDKLLNTSAKSLQAQVQLRELQSMSNSYSSLYNSFLERYVQTVQQQSFPVSEARVITPAAKPLKSTGPGTMMVLGAALAFGGFLGMGLGIGRELMDATVTTPEQLEKLSGTDFLGVLPITRRPQEQREDTPAEAPEKSRSVSRPPASMRQVLDAPFSHYAETIRSIKVAADALRLSRKFQLIGVVSALPGEGKTTVSTNLGFLLAQTAGARTLLMDMDLRNPSQTMKLGRNRDGLIQILAGERSFNEVVTTHGATGLHFLPAGVRRPIPNTNALLAAQAMQDLLIELRLRYDYVVLDLPPLAPVVDARGIAHLVDGFVLITEFAKTSKDVLRRALRSAPSVQDKLFGAVLNKVDLKALGRMDAAGSDYYSSSYYFDEPPPAR